MKNPITPTSVYSKRRRLPQLRKLFFKLRSMRRKRFAMIIFSKTTKDDAVIIKLVDESILFLKCNFGNVDNQEIANACDKLIKALRLVRNDIIRALNSLNRRAIQKSVIRCLGKATTNLYKAARSHSVANNCDDLWVKLGCLADILLLPELIDSNKIC
jgi:hypothetical protein